MISAQILSFVCFFAVLVAAGIDPYAVLGVARNADEKTIKSQYRQLSKQYHPDKNPDPEAHEKFIEVGEAYGILNDAEKRQNYDKFGDPNGPQQGGPGGPGDMFNQFFNGGHHGHGQPQQRRGPDTQVIIHLTLQDFFLGKDADFGVQMQNICETCTGSGSADGKRKKCSKCKGKGVFTQTVNMGFMIQQFQTACDQCQGSGSVIANRCKTCGGAGAARGHRHYNVFVQPGTAKNHVHVLEGEGDQNPDWVPGNLNLRFVESPNENWGFRRIGDNLYRTEVLTTKEAVSGGWKREFAFFDDEMVELKREKGQVVFDGQVEVLQGHGMPSSHDHDEHGNLFIEYKVLPVGNSAPEKDEL